MKFRRSEHVQVVKTLGERMRAAREIYGLSQISAASLLGYANSSKLAKIEGSIDSVPLWLIPKAAEVYGVSIDFLFGISDEWERDPVFSQERQIGKWLEDHWQQAQVAQNHAFKALHAKQAELSEAVVRTKRRAKENLEQVERVRELNPAFDELKGGAKLLRLLIETAEEAMGLSYELNNIRSLDQAERLMDDISGNPRHPVNDPKHQDYQPAKQALDELKSKIDESRVRLGVERCSKNEKLETTIK